MASQTIQNRADGSTQPRQSVAPLIQPRDLPAMVGCYLAVAFFAAAAMFPRDVAGFLRFVADFLTGGAL